MSNWPPSATTYPTILNEWYFSPRFHPASTMKQEFRNQISISPPNMIFTNNTESGSKLLTSCLLSHLAVPEFSRPSLELPKNLVPNLNMYLQNELDRTLTDSESLSLPTTSSNEKGLSKQAKNCKVDAFSIESLLSKTNSSRTTMNMRLPENSFPKELSTSNIQICERGTTRYTLDALQSTDGRSKRKKELNTDKE
ncbi:unnamed protein product, partial [Onchocerca ochengi]|uniref:Ovule protein n=1 Tax=Onchocerca ochengi TaxID=42157 RepID=A0A182E1G7_ONCOC